MTITGEVVAITAMLVLVGVFGIAVVSGVIRLSKDRPTGRSGSA